MTNSMDSSLDQQTCGGTDARMSTNTTSIMEIAQRQLDAEGYIVVCLHAGPIPNVGEVIHRDILSRGNGRIPGPLVCVGFSGIDEYMALFDKYVGDRGGWRAVTYADALNAIAFLKCVAE